MQPGTDQFGQPAQPGPQPHVIGQPVQPQYGQPPQQQVVGQPATIVGQPTVGTGVPLGQQMMVGEAQSTNAMIGLVLGILGIIGSFFYGIGCLCGVIGLIITYGAKKITDLNPMHPDKGTVKAALITNWIAVILAVLMLVTVVLAGVLYVWANSLAGDQTNSAGTLNSYFAEDASAETTSDTNDGLIRLGWITAEDDLSWPFVQIKITVDGITYDCVTDTSTECTITEQDADNAWREDEIITLSENGHNIADGATNIDLYITYRGITVAGDTSVAIS